MKQPFEWATGIVLALLTTIVQAQGGDSARDITPTDKEGTTSERIAGCYILWT